MQKKVVTNFCKINIIYITVITVIFAVIVVMIIVVVIIKIVDVAFGTANISTNIIFYH